MSETPKNWNKLTVADLKDELQTRGLPTSGRKSELIDRLILHDSEGRSLWSCIALLNLMGRVVVELNK